MGCANDFPFTGTFECLRQRPHRCSASMNRPEQLVLLDEGGIKITADHLFVPGKSFKWRNLGIVRIVRRGVSLGALFRPTFQLVISRKKEPAPFTVFETTDAELAKRIDAAINAVAQQLGATREK
jgi:hypothetical protein